MRCKSTQAALSEFGFTYLAVISDCEPFGGSREGGLFVAELLAEELLAAFATGYHEDTEQDEDSRGYFGECELILTHHDSQHGGNDGDAVVVDADDGRAQASLCEEQQEVGDEGGAHDDEG